jgi:hypothetical protein
MKRYRIPCNKTLYGKPPDNWFDMQVSSATLKTNETFVILESADRIHRILSSTQEGWIFFAEDRLHYIEVAES